MMFLRWRYKGQGILHKFIYQDYKWYASLFPLISSIVGLQRIVLVDIVGGLLMVQAGLLHMLIGLLRMVALT